MITEYVKNWFQRAGDDLNLIEIVLREPSFSPNPLCFHAQQAAEKYLKGFLAHNDLHVRKIHDLEALIGDCAQIDKSFEELRNNARFLNQFYIESRYPDDYTQFSPNNAKEAYETALKIKTFVLEKINKTQKGFVAPLALVVVIVAIILGIIGITGFAAYKYFAPKQRVDTTTSPISISDKIVDWKTFRNEKYGFEIQYPNDWPAPTQEQTNYGGGVSFVFNKKIIITYYKNDSDLPDNAEKNLNIDEWLSNPQNYYFNSANFNRLENVVIGDNYPATKTYKSYCNATPLLTNEYFTLKGAGSIYEEHGDIYQIEGPMFDCLGQTNETQRNNHSREYEKYEKILNQMLSTFKFIPVK